MTDESHAAGLTGSAHPEQAGWSNLCLWQCAKKGTINGAICLQAVMEYVLFMMPVKLLTGLTAAGTQIHQQLQAKGHS